jgi:uncharacterized protein YfkK (UPF0435 family)
MVPSQGFSHSMRMQSGLLIFQLFEHADKLDVLNVTVLSHDKAEAA